MPISICDIHVLKLKRNLLKSMFVSMWPIILAPQIHCDHFTNKRSHNTEYKESDAFKCPSCARYVVDLVPLNSKKKGKSWLCAAYHCMLSPWHRLNTCKYVYIHTQPGKRHGGRCFFNLNKEERRRLIPQSISSLFALGSKLSPYNTVWQHRLCMLLRHCPSIAYNW